MSASDVIVTVDNPVIVVTVGQQGPPGVAVGVTGTGFVHITGGVLDPAARAVNLASADVTGLLPVANIAPGSNGQVLTTTGGVAAWGAVSGAPTGPAGGDLSGTYPNPQVAAATGNAGTFALAATAAAILWAAGAVAPSLSQTATGSASGASMTIAAQAGATSGGGLLLSSGAGSSAANAGPVELQTGGTVRWRAAATTTAGNAAFVSVASDPLEFGTGKMPTSGFGLVRFPNTTGVTVLLAQKDTPAGGTIDLPIVSSDPNAYIINIGATTDATFSAKWSHVNLRSATEINLHSLAIWSWCSNQIWFDTSGGALEYFRIGGTGSATVTQTFAVGTTPLIKQADLNVASAGGAVFTIQAQNSIGATATGGKLALTSGTGTTAAGNLELQTGGTAKVIIAPTAITVGDSTVTTCTLRTSTATIYKDGGGNEAFRVTPVSSGTTVLQFAGTVTAATINHATIVGAGVAMLIQAQGSSGGVGGDLQLEGGAGSIGPNNGLVRIQNGSGANVASFSGASIKLAQPVWGDDAASALWSMHGTNVTAVTTGGSTTTVLSAAAAAKHIQIFTGIPTAAQTIQIGAVADGWWKILHNKCTGTFSTLTIKAATGASITISTLEKWIVWCDNTDLIAGKLT